MPFYAAFTDRFLSLCDRVLLRLKLWRDHPDLLRRTLRNSVPGQILVCALMGIVVGSVVIGVHHTIAYLHHVLYMISDDDHLSSAPTINRRLVILVPIIGGALVGLGVILHRRWNLQEVMDPIEANAIHGGNLSFWASMRLVWSVFLSNVLGMAVGMEAAYTQLGSSFLSSVGKFLHLRREDLRIFIAAGAAAAIAAAFNSPLAGAFYAFELILGIYTVNALSQVAVAALFGTVAAHVFTNGEPIFALPMDTADIPNWYYALYMLEGVGGAVIGIAIMYAVTQYEALADRLTMPGWLRPILGGALFGLLAASFPQVMGSGQGAINYHLHEIWPIWMLAALLLAKIIGAVLSIGSGFRGGLFSTSLFIGCLFGQMFGLATGHFLPSGEEHLDIFMLVGMGAVTASVVGTPVTIVLLVLEMTGNLPAMTSVLMGVLISSALTRHLFGYSFSTWRFHLRGLRIEGAHDVGWVQEIRVSSLMRTEIAVAPIGSSVALLMKMPAANTGDYIYLVDERGDYAGRVARRVLADAEATQVASLATAGDHYLMEGQDIRQALEQFSQWEAEELPVLGGASGRVPVGRLKEAYTLRRYAEALEKQSRLQLGAGLGVKA